MEIIHINWEGPISFDDVNNLKNKEDFGVYQLYGCHPVYGQNILLYIGRAKDMKFGERISQHRLNEWTGSSCNVFVGRLCGENQPADDIWSRQIEEAEELLIYAHAPSWNSSNIQNFGEIGDVHIFNWGNREALLPEVSTSRWNNANQLMPKNLKIFELIKKRD